MNLVWSAVKLLGAGTTSYGDEHRARSARNGLLASLVLVLPLAVAMSPAAQAESWNWSITPYAWLIGTEFSTAIDIPEDGEQEFKDIGKNLDFAAQLHVEGQGDRFGMMLDLTNLQLSDRTEQAGYVLKTDSSTTLVEAAALISFGESERGEAALLVGARLLNVDFELDVLRQEGGDPLVASAADRTLTDAMLGVRYRHRLNEDWTLNLRADVATGDTDFSWNTAIVAGRDVGSSGQFLVGYRYLNVEFKKADELLDPTLVVSGPMLGYSFRF